MPVPAIFLSYARDDAAAARRIAEALRSTGVEVWFDENELRGGDEWDRKIRRQIDECTLFVPLISQHTEARAKGYFRFEWKLAVDQMQMMAAGVPFIAPVAIDDTRETGAVVPPEFMRVQWMRLPGALPTPEFVAQMKRLLDAPRLPVMEPGRPRPGERGEGAASPAMKSETARGVPAAAWIGAVAVIAIGIAAVFFATRKTESAPPVGASNAGAGMLPPAADKSAVPMSEARQLVAKARALYEPWDLASREDFALAEQLLKKVVALDPTDGEAWAAYALLSCGAVVLNKDYSAERKAAVRLQAERAIKFAPDSNASRFARALSLRFNPQTLDECIRLLREEAARQPTNRLVVRNLGSALRSTGRLEQALVYFDKAAALPGNDPVTQHNRGLVLFLMNRFAEAEAAFDEALAAAPNYIRANQWKLYLLLDVRGDLPRAQAHLAKVPPAFFLDDDGAVIAYLTAIYSKDAEKCLNVLRQASDYLSTLEYTGPKSVLTARAHRLAGNEEAARTDFRAALRLVDEKLVAQPNASLPLFRRAEILASLGERATVEPLLREIRQRVSTGDEYLNEYYAAHLLVLMDQPEKALEALQSFYGKPSPTYRSRVGLRYHPVWDPLRGNPRFEALLKVSESKK